MMGGLLISSSGEYQVAMTEEPPSHDGVEDSQSI